MRTIALLALLSLTACSGFPLVEDSGGSRLTVREFSALQSIPGGFAPTERRSYLPRSGGLALVSVDEGLGLTVQETVALESIYGAFGPVDERDEVRRGVSLSFVTSTRGRVDARTMRAIDGLPRSAFGLY